MIKSSAKPLPCCWGAAVLTEGGPASVTADAVDDVITDPIATGASSALTVSTNDVACSTGATTYALVAGSEVNCTVALTDANTGAVNVTPTADGAWSFQYQLLCDGVVTDTATVSGTAAALVTADAVNDVVADPLITGSATTVTVLINDTPCSSGVTTFALVAGSEANCTVTLTDASAGTFGVTPTADGAWSYQYDLLCDGVIVDTANVSGTAVTSAGPQTWDSPWTNCGRPSYASALDYGTTEYFVTMGVYLEPTENKTLRNVSIGQVVAGDNSGGGAEDVIASIVLLERAAGSNSPTGLTELKRIDVSDQVIYGFTQATVFSADLNYPLEAGKHYATALELSTGATSAWMLIAAEGATGTVGAIDTGYGVQIGSTDLNANMNTLMWGSYDNVTGTTSLSYEGASLPCGYSITLE